MLGRSLWQLLCLSLALCFWTGLKINFWMPIMSKPSYTPQQCLRARWCPVQTHFFQVCFFLHLDSYFSSVKSMPIPNKARGLCRCVLGRGGCRQAAFYSITSLSTAPGKDVLQLTGFRKLLPAHLSVCLWGFPRRKTVAFLSWLIMSLGKWLFLSACMLSPSARRCSLLALLCFFISMLTKTDGPGFQFPSL